MFQKATERLSTCLFRCFPLAREASAAYGRQRFFTSAGFSLLFTLSASPFSAKKQQNCCQLAFFVAFHPLSPAFFRQKATKRPPTYLFRCFSLAGWASKARSWQHPSRQTIQKLTIHCRHFTNLATLIFPSSHRTVICPQSMVHRCHNKSSSIRPRASFPGWP